MKMGTSTGSPRNVFVGGACVRRRVRPWVAAAAGGAHPTPARAPGIPARAHRNRRGWRSGRRIPVGAAVRGALPKFTVPSRLNRLGKRTGRDATPPQPFAFRQAQPQRKANVLIL